MDAKSEKELLDIWSPSLAEKDQNFGYPKMEKFYKQQRESAGSLESGAEPDGGTDNEETEES